MPRKNPKEYYQMHKDKWIEYKERSKVKMREKYASDSEYRAKVNARNKQYWLENPEKFVQQRYRRKLKVLEMCGGAKCVRCGNDFVGMLEINHKNGGGSKEIDSVGGGSNFKQRILDGRRTTEDLNVLCRACQGPDHSERKYPEVKGWTVIVFGRTKEERITALKTELGRQES